MVAKWAVTPLGLAGVHPQLTALGRSFLSESEAVVSQEGRTSVRAQQGTSCRLLPELTRSLSQEPLIILTGTPGGWGSCVSLMHSHGDPGVVV